MKKIIVSILILPSLYGCTGIRLQSKDSAVIAARTLEFGANVIQTNIIFVPRATAYVGTTPLKNTAGHKWQSKYAFIGINFFNYPHVMDGLNEKGLNVGLFYFPDYAKYPTFDKQNAANTLAPWELGTWIVSNFSSVNEVLQNIRNITIAPTIASELGFSPPVHYIVHDAAGNSLVIEYINGICFTHQNKLGVFTNAPSFDWHTTNLKNYINLSAFNVQAFDLSGIHMTGFGQGTGFLGIPGDFTPPSRFVRATAFVQSSVPADTALNAVKSAFHILNSFDIPKGSVRELINKKTSYEVTQFTSACDLKNLILYFHTYENRQIQCVTLNKFNVNGKEIALVTMHEPEKIVDISNQTHIFNAPITK
jgi:choloylglycine hydrolase